VIIVLNLSRLAVCFCSLLLLQACQHNNTFKAEGGHGSQKQNNAAAYNIQLGLAYLKQGDRPRAKYKLLTAIDLAPNSAEANAAMAYFLEMTGELKEARNFYKKALSLAPGNGAQLNNFGSYLCRQNKYKEAESYFLSAAKDVRYLHTAQVYENAGLCAAAIPDLPKAEHYFTKALEQDPLRKQALYELVKMKIKQNQAGKALAYMEQYSKLTLNEPALLKLAIDASHRLGRTRSEEAYKSDLYNLNHV